MSPRNDVQDSAAAQPQLDLAGLGAPARPQVNLLPPEVYSKRALGKTKTRMLFVLVGVLAVAGAGFAYAMLEEANAADDLTTAQAEVDRLTLEKAQYAEVPALNQEISRVEDARLYGMQTEVLWKDFIAALQAVTPPGVSLESVVFDLPSPGVPASVAANPLAAESVGTLNFTAHSDTLPNIGAWMDAIETIPGFADPTFTAATRTGDAETGDSYYTYTATVQIDQTVFANRFVEEAGE